jgi:hypothetical protein
MRQCELAFICLRINKWRLHRCSRELAADDTEMLHCVWGLCMYIRMYRGGEKHEMCEVGRPRLYI